MPLTPDQLDNWFTYHASTDDTAPKYAAVIAAETAAIANITQTHYEVGGDVLQVYREVNRSTRHVAEVIDANAPDSADKDAAIRCVRLARNLFNEWAKQTSLPATHRQWSNPTVLFAAAEVELCKARMQANSAIACGGK